MRQVLILVWNVAVKEESKVNKSNKDKVKSPGLGEEECGTRSQVASYEPVMNLKLTHMSS